MVSVFVDHPVEATLLYLNNCSRAGVYNYFALAKVQYSTGTVITALGLCWGDRGFNFKLLHIRARPWLTQMTCASVAKQYNLAPA